MAEDRSRPFRVLTTGQTVEVLGTRFNINTCRGECTYTTLLEGSIRISAAGQELFLSPDMEAAVSSKGITTRPVHADRIASWREGLFVLEHRTLEAVMADLAGWYNFTVEYEDEQLKQVSFRGAVPRADHLTEVLDILSLTGEVNFSIRHDKIIVKR
ncbi:MAG: DUF4974 domain-containing protein [Rikenellaceae bacterium]|nr:DUF4974 domain-containing protein [Rikenellaceae bacterium]